MQRTPFSGLAAIVVAGLFLAACGSNTIKKEEQSGYLKDYSNVTETKDPMGHTVYRYVSPKFNPGNYSAVMIQPVEYFPKPEPTEQVSQATLDQIRTYLDESLKKAIGAKVKLADKPGPGVARLNVAITAAVGEKESLKAYQYLPIALIATGAKRAVTGTPQEAHLVIEAQATDSVSGETLLKAVRSGEGKELNKVDGQRVLTVEELKPLIDKWAEGVAAQTTTFVKAK